MKSLLCPLAVRCGKEQFAPAPKTINTNLSHFTKKKKIKALETLCIMFRFYHELEMFSSHTDCGDSRNDLPQLQLVENGGFTSSVQPHHQNPHLLFAYQAL